MLASDAKFRWPQIFWNFSGVVLTAPGACQVCVSNA
jgi:hypothetical protein